MQYIEIKKLLKNDPLISLKELHKINANFDRRRLHEWQKKDYIKKITKGFYIFTDIDLNENITFNIANKIYAPSYISLETALNYYGIIPESTYLVTSISTRKTYNFQTNLVSFSYNTIKPQAFFGYFINKNNNNFKMAYPEKAILDYLYLHPNIKEISDFDSLRFNKEVITNILNKSKFTEYLNKFSNKSLNIRAKIFMDFLKLWST